MAWAEMMRVLMAWTLLLTGYEDPGGYPEISFATPAELSLMICPRAPNGCGIRGVYHDGKIWLSKEYDLKTDEYARSILVHEFTHWLQDMNNDYEYEGYEGCEKANQREVEAYGVQNAYLRQAEKSQNMVRNQVPSCARWYAPKLDRR